MMGHVISVIAAVISVIKTAIESKEISRVPQGEWSLIATNKFKPSSSHSDWAACWQAGWLTQLSAHFLDDSLVESYQLQFITTA